MPYGSSELPSEREPSLLRKLDIAGGRENTDRFGLRRLMANTGRLSLVFRWSSSALDFRSRYGVGRGDSGWWHLVGCALLSKLDPSVRILLSGLIAHPWLPDGGGTTGLDGVTRAGATCTRAGC